MNLHITGRHIEVTPAIREYVENKIGRLHKHFDSIVEAQVILSVERVKHNAEITVHVAGKDLHCSCSEDSLYAAIDVLADKIERQIVKYKTKQTPSHHQPHKRMETPSATPTQS